MLDAATGRARDRAAGRGVGATGGEPFVQDLAVEVFQGACKLVAPAAFPVLLGRAALALVDISRACHAILVTGTARTVLFPRSALFVHAVLAGLLSLRRRR